jgi:hypothetical protein
MLKSLAVETVGSMILLRENRHTPTNSDWDDFMRLLVENRENFPRLKILVVTDGGGPNADQRKRLEKALAGRPVRVAVVTDSTKVRFIVSSIALLNREIKTFSMNEMKDAHAHLSLTTAEQIQAAQVLQRLESSIDPELKL